MQKTLRDVGDFGVPLRLPGDNLGGIYLNRKRMKSRKDPILRVRAMIKNDIM